MANFTAAINALVNERDRVFLLRVAADYNLKFEELQQKYLETAEVAIKVPRKYTKKPKEVKVAEVPTEGGAAAPAAKPAKGEKQCCTAQTSKKEPCKFSALKGEVFCKRHLKQHIDGGSAPAEPKAKVPKAPKAAKVPALEPVHAHTISTEVDAECNLCQSHGNPLATEPEMFELVKPTAATTVEDRLAALLADADEDDGSASEAGSSLEEEDYDDEE